MRNDQRARRPHRQGERGFTLIEVIVSVSVLTIIAGAIAAVFSVGLQVLSPGGPQTRLLGSSDLMSLEQTLGQDGARAACAQVPTGGGSAKYPNPGCSNGFAKVTCASTDLCFGWPQVSDSSCHVVDYSLSASTAATRTEYSVSSGGVVSTVSSGPLARSVHVGLAVPAGSVGTVSPAGETYTWLRSVSVSIVALGATNGPTQTLTLHPVATDPAGTSSAITPGGSPC